MLKPTLYILAAGMASRYGGLKQIEGVGPNGETIMDYSIFDAIRAGFGRVVFVIRRDFEDAFREKILSKYSKHIDTDVVFQSPDALPDGFSTPATREKPWGTNHAVMMAADVIREPFLVINADDFYGFDAFKQAADFLSNPDLQPGQYCVIGYKIANTVPNTGSVNRGICEVDSNGYLKKIVETINIEKIDGVIKYTNDSGEHILSPETPVSMNMLGFTPDYFEHSMEYFKNTWLPQNINSPRNEFFIPLMIDVLIQNGTATCKCLDTSAEWFGVTYPEDKPDVIAKIQNLIDTGEYPNKLFG